MMESINTTSVLTDEQVAKIEARYKEASPGPWTSDNEQDSEHHYQYYMALDPESRTVFDTLNSSIGEIHEEADEDGVYRWDEIARRNIAFASHAREDVPALCATVRALRVRLEESEVHNRAIRERLVIADGVYDEKGGYTIHAQTAIHRATSDLQRRLSEVERERDDANQRAQDAQASVEHLTSIIFANRHAHHMRSRAIELCKVKAAEYEAVHPEAAHALHAVAGKLEQLK